MESSLTRTISLSESSGVVTLASSSSSSQPLVPISESDDNNNNNNSSSSNHGGVVGVGGSSTSPSAGLDEEPVKKRQKTGSASSSLDSAGKDGQREKLEHRLGGILCCTVCLDLPKTSVFQCSNGHLICCSCLVHVLADARLKDEQATCPNCRCTISKDLCSRNLAVEKAISELPTQCRFCEEEYSRAEVSNHENECEERLVKCNYSRVGCPWRGPFHELANHEECCSHPKKSGKEILKALEILDKQEREEKKLYDTIFDLLSYEKLSFHDLQLKPYRTDEFIHRLYYETSRFSAFNYQWVVKARINDDQKDPTQSCERKLSYQLILKSKIASPLLIHYLVLKGPFGEMKLHPRIHRFEFTESNSEAPFNWLALTHANDCNKLLAAKAINFRLILFQMPK